MTDAQRDLFGFVGAALGVIVGLFVLQELYASWIDVRAHAQLAAAGVSPELAAVRAAEAKKLAAGKLPIERAMQAVAGRARASTVAPAPSDDLSAMSGWIHRPGFQPYVPRSERVVAAPAPAAGAFAPVEAGEETPVPEGAEAAPTGAEAAPTAVEGQE
jgi:hypothetical protein